MNISADKAKIRDSIILHLETLKSFGVAHVIPEQPKEAATDSATCTQNKATTHDLCNSLTELNDFIGLCTRCPLHKQRKNLVFGVGNPSAKLMFAGEGPGHEEDAQGIPFVGRAGQLLTKMIEAMGYQRDNVYIANVVKCRPPENRNPLPEEIDLCLPFLKKQIALIQPEVIVCLGKFAAQTLLETQTPISRLRGTLYEKNGLYIMPTFHPAYLLRNPQMKKAAWEDLKKVMAHLKCY